MKYRLPEDDYIAVIGAGGIGSYLTYYLGRIDNFDISLYDFDSVDESNFGGQMFTMDQIGQSKAIAAWENMKIFSDVKHAIHTMGKFDEECDATPVTFVCPDNILARRIAFDKWRQLPDRKIFIDGRMLAETGFVYVVIPGREAEYEKTLFNDEDVEDVLCSMKATSHCGAMTGALMMSMFNNWCANQVVGANAFETPFKLEFSLQFAHFERSNTNDKSI